MKTSIFTASPVAALSQWHAIGMHKRPKIFLMCGVILPALWLGSDANAAVSSAPFTLSSTTFKDGGLMPPKVANRRNPTNPDPNCIGDNVSPQLSWSGAPDGTKSYVLTMVDLEGRGGLGIVHWVAYGIPAHVTSLQEGEVGFPYYSGPCTPPGSPHHYVLKIIATDFDPIELLPGLTLNELTAKLTTTAAGQPSHARAAAVLVGFFAR